MLSLHPYAIFHLGDAALTIDFLHQEGSAMEISDELHAKVMKLYHALGRSELSYIRDLVPAFNALGVYYDVAAIKRDHPNQTAFETMAAMIREVYNDTIREGQPEPRLHQVPVCYADSFAPDMELLARESRLDKSEIISIHTSGTYKVYMLGFLPGFPYLGIVDERIRISRKLKPRQQVSAGSVGIAGMQTGIYPVDSPGGWQIIGRTPIKIFDADSSPPVVFTPGDLVKFHSITEDEYKDYQFRHT